jgi:arginine repressor
LRDPDSNPVDRALDILLALRELARGPSARHQHDAPKTDALRPYKHVILDALRKVSLDQIVQLLNERGFEISKAQLARAVQLFKKETRAERAGAQSPTTASPGPSTQPVDRKLEQAAVHLVALAQGSTQRYPRPAPKQDQLRERREQLLQDRKQGKSIPQIVQELRKQGIKISNAQALRIINLFQTEERAARSTYNLQAAEPSAVREDPTKAAPQSESKPSSEPPSKPKQSVSAKAREEDLEKSIKQARRSAAKAQKTKLPSGQAERTKQGPSRQAPDR